MNASASPFSVSDTAPELVQRFALILAGLGALVARRFLRLPHLMRFTVLLHGRLSRAVRRFERMLAGPAGKVRAPRVRADRRATTQARPVALPSGRGWIVRELGWEAAAYMSLLEALLAEVETQVTLAALPGAGRVLRPICRMLGVSVAALPVTVAQPAPVELVGLSVQLAGLSGVVGNCARVAKSE